MLCIFRIAVYYICIYLNDLSILTFLLLIVYNTVAVDRCKTFIRRDNGFLRYVVPMRCFDALAEISVLFFSRKVYRVRV